MCLVYILHSLTTQQCVQYFSVQGTEHETVGKSMFTISKITVEVSVLPQCFIPDVPDVGQQLKCIFFALNILLLPITSGKNQA